MKVLVIGGGGKTGRLVVEAAARAGHAVTAFVHKPEPFQNGVTVVVGDAEEAAALDGAVDGQDAVIDTIGGTTPYKDTGLEVSTARKLVAAMRAKGARRLVVVSAMGVDDSVDNAPFWYEWLLMPTMLRGVAKEKTAMEAEVRSAGLDFVIVRPALLTDVQGGAPLRVASAGEKVRSTSRGDLARFLVEQLDSDIHLNGAVVVANA